MSTSSKRSSRSRISTRDRVTNEDVYDYALRVAYLSYLMAPKVSTTPPNGEGTKEKDHRDYSFKLPGALSNGIYSIGDLFKDMGRDGPRAVKFPEKLLKVLDAKMQNIAMGKDPGYTDQYIRRTIAVFWGSLKEPTFLRQMKENRKIEELILMFVSTATAALKKDPQLAGDAWKIELNNQIAQFVRMLRQCLNQVNHVPPELTARLDMITAKLAPDEAVPQSHNSRPDSIISRPESAGPVISLGIADMPLVQTVARLFGYSNQDVQNDINALKKLCTEKAALTDLKTCLKNIDANMPFPGSREDFETEEAYQYWRTQERTHLSQLMVVMVQFNPSLAKSTPSEAIPTAPSPRPESMYSSGRDLDSDGAVSRRASASSRFSLAVPSLNPDAISEAIQEDDDTPLGHTFTYIPPNPKKFYKRLLELCLEYDLRAMSSLPEDQEVSLGILSTRHLEVMNECAIRWRVMSTYRVACFLDVIKYKFERDEVPLECIPEGLQMVSKTIHETPLDKWPMDDSEYLSAVYGALFNIFLGSLYHTLDDLETLKMDDITPFLEILEEVRDSGLVERFKVDVSARVADLCERVREVASLRYSMKSQELTSQPGVNCALPLLYLTDYIEKQAKLLDKRFPEPILGKLDFVSLVLECQIPLFLNDLEYSRRRLLEGSMNQPTPDVPIEDIFALYRRTKTILSMHEAFCPDSPEDFDLVLFFEPYVLQWLINTDNKTAQWVNTAINMDKFEAEGEEGHSSSIVDLFGFFKPPIDFLLDLDWTDPLKEAHYFTTLSKTISKSIEQYCRGVEELFMAEMYPRPTQEVQPAKQTLIEKAKALTIAGEKKVEPFNFSASSCVKLNNIEAARALLDQLYARIDADKIADTLAQQGPPVPSKAAKEKFLFAVKIVSAENLASLDGGTSKLDTFITLSDEKGIRLAKTRTIYESLNPRWEETFDISVETPLWLMSSVRDRALIGKHDTIGRAYLCLDPKRYGDFLTHDEWLNLDTQGRILMRISMEGEKDDIQFYFGRAFRSLKRAEGDMTRIFIDKMSPLIQQTISRSTLKALIKIAPTIDVNKAFGNLQGLYRSAIGATSDEPQIPLPQQEKPRLRADQLTDVEIESAISPLFDYFETNLMVLNSSLSDATREIVMVRVWKEILIVVEGLLLPPLSDAPSDMNPLTEKEVDIVFKWLKFLRDYFYAGGEGPVPLEILQNQKYRDIISIRLYYDWSTDDLMMECVRMMQQTLHSAPTMKKRAKSVYQQKNLGTIKDRKREKRKQQEDSNASIIMRVLRMRPGTSDFLAQQLRIMAQMQSEQEQRAARIENRRSGRSPIPPVPPLPR